ncbi:RNA-binding S4 domain-containing protein [Methylovirgula sp. 4M-Z18]|uniref:RNA-binding S4 domain-containing protein n=1 Tax=Methylovirgula sp. 4M-Z18 TaxID=2293567 RepID=UPI000E2E4D06|nr:RNA-binding S4 domain-containing protein [Methylovirgula sp. 4M-Z18]RFB74975.1 RNA-binding S4 domain-containing protein [Methylovirgula sp. 4M-Z18]
MREAGADNARQRLDKWLWFARVVKTRSLAAKLVTDGHVRVNSVKVETPSKAVRQGDVITISLDRAVRVLKVVQGGTRRGPYEEAKGLFEELTDPEPAVQAGEVRPPGEGRPTKQDRRAIDRLKNG